VNCEQYVSETTKLIRVQSARKIGFCCGLSRELNAAWNKSSLSGQLSEASKDFMKIWLFVDGPERILAGLSVRIRKSTGRDGTCIIVTFVWHCFKNPLVRETIADNYRERVDDVLMRYSVLLRQQREDYYGLQDLGGYWFGKPLGGMQISLVTACSAIMAAMLRHFDI
jgi:hypothetical protein